MPLHDPYGSFLEALAAWLKTLIAASLVSVGEINHAAGRCPYRSKMACRRTLLAVP